MGRSVIRALLAASLLAVVAASGHAQSQSQSEWETVLRLQLADESKCEFLRIVSMRQLPVSGLDEIEGRVRCTDGREFDFSRQKAHQKFTIRLCQPAVC
ncbi:MAG: hypothetical protein SFW09_04650 [Hyphomicrobiaceae bacterium]|nr:hypothetical protein [Hyphomicrobiaceae bacterium]